MFRSGPSVIVTWLFGVLAAAQLPKFAIIAPILRQRFGLSLVDVGLLISLLEIGGALFGLGAGLALARVGERRCLLTGLALLGLAGWSRVSRPGSNFCSPPGPLRGLAYLGVVIAAPTLMVGLGEARNRSSAMALWSTFVPVGVAAGSIGGGLLVSAAGIQAMVLFWAALSLLALAIATRLPYGRRASRARRLAIPHPGAWLSTIGFGCYTMFICALTALCPTYLVRYAGRRSAPPVRPLAWWLWEHSWARPCRSR